MMQTIFPKYHPGEKVTVRAECVFGYAHVTEVEIVSVGVQNPHGRETATNHWYIGVGAKGEFPVLVSEEQIKGRLTGRKISRNGGNGDDSE
jgi:hypothetical protein